MFDNAIMYANNIPIVLKVYITKIFVYLHNSLLIVGSCIKLFHA